MKMMGKKVYIVGAGPGDPGFLTRRALEVLQEAEVIIYDRLVGEGIMALFPPDAECIDVGKEPGSHPVPQRAIEELLREKAREGKRVVRLKGGDPYVFGRGGEEALFLLQEGVEVEVVPGVSSALAVPALAGIPLTHRGMSASFMVVSGHDLEKLNWEVLVRFSGTLVVLMGARNLGMFIEELRKRGKPAHLPVALIMEGATAKQRVLLGTLGDIADRAEQSGFRNPLVLVLGEAVFLREKLALWERRPLFGKRLLITGTTRESFAFPLLGELGVEILHYPTVHIKFFPEALSALYHRIAECRILLLSSKNAVWAFREMLRTYRVDARYFQGVSFVVVGRKTARELESIGIFPDYLPSSFTVSALSEVLPPGKGELALILTSQIGGEEGERMLAERGYRAERIALYRSLPHWRVKDWIRGALQQGIDAAVFTSPSSFSYLEEMLEGSRELLAGVLLVAIGPTTARFMEKRGFPAVDFPEEHTLEGVETFLLRRWEKS